MNYDYIGATGISTTIDYIDMTSNTLNKRIDDIDLETSNISSNISSNYTQGLRNELWEVNPNNSNCLIKTIRDNNINDTHIINNNIDGEIRFNTLASAGFNLGGLDHNTKIDYLGRLKVYHNYDLTQPTILGGWYDVDYEIAQIKADGVNTDIQLSVLDASIVDIQAVQIPELSSALATYGQLIGNTQLITESLTNELEWLITNDKISFIRNRTNNYNELVQSLAEVQDAPTNFITKTIQGAGDLLQIGTIGSIGFGLCAGFGALGEWIKLRNIASNITPSNFTITQSQRRQLIDSNTSNQILIMDDIFNNISNANIKKGFINSNISTIQFIPSLRSNKIIIGNDAPNTAYQLQLSGDANLNMLYLNNTSLQSLLNQKQGNLTFNNPLLNTTDTISLKKDSSLTLDGSGNLKVVKTATQPLIWTGNDVSLSYDSTLTLSGSSLSVASASGSKWTTSGTNIYNNNYSTGNIGIGLTAPTEKLDVNGNIYSRSNIAIGYSPLNLTPTFTGSSLTAISGTNESYLLYTTNGTFVINEPCACDVLCVGAGGNGGSGSSSGGGGAGEVIYYPNYSFPAGSYSITVGTQSTTVANRISKITLGINDLIKATGGGNGGASIYSTSGSGTVSSITSISGTNDSYLSFTAGTVSLVLNSSITCDIFMIGGGGGGGANHGGGGGAGAYYYGTNQTLNSGTYTITIGAGGAGAINPQSGTIVAGANGGNTSISLGGTIIYLVNGGGKAGTYNSPLLGQDGGCGGGGTGWNGNGYTTTTRAGGSAVNTGTNGTGFGGGTGNQNTSASGGASYFGGGGGGIGGAGGNAPTYGNGTSGGLGGAGGAGLNNNITGNNVVYGGGGGGNGWNSVAGGVGGGVSGTIVGGSGSATGGQAGGNGVANTGSGGGGGGPGWGSGGSGGSGVVIIRIKNYTTLTNPQSGGCGGGGYLNQSGAVAGGAWNSSYSYLTSGISGTASSGGNGGSATASGRFSTTITGTALTVGGGGTGVSGTPTPATKNNYGDGGDGNGGVGYQGVVILRLKEPSYLSVKAIPNNLNSGLIINANYSGFKNQLRISPFVDGTDPYTFRGYNFHMIDSVLGVNCTPLTLFNVYGGRVGINKQFPTAQLDVGGNLRCDYFSVVRNINDISICQIQNQNSGQYACCTLEFIQDANTASFTLNSTNSTLGTPSLFEIYNGQGDMKFRTTGSKYLYLKRDYGFGINKVPSTAGISLDVEGLSTFTNTIDGAHYLKMYNFSSGTSAHSYFHLINNTGNGCTLFLNSSGRSTDGGVNCATLRNDCGSLRLCSAGDTPSITLDDGTDTIYINGRANVRQANGANSYAVPNNYMKDASLTIGSINNNYGGGTSGWNTNTAGLLLECYDNTEIAVHDSGQRICSLLYYEGGLNNNIYIGRDMGGGYGKTNNIFFACNYINFAYQYWSIGVATPSGSGTANSLVFLHNDGVTYNSKWWLSGTQTNTSSEISDERIKKDIKEIDDASSLLLKLKPKEYHLCEDKDKNRKIGIIAQDVEKEEELKDLIFKEPDYIANILSNGEFIKEQIGETKPSADPNINYEKTPDNPTPPPKPKPEPIYRYMIKAEKSLKDLIEVDDEIKIVLDNRDDNIKEIVMDDTPYNNRYKRRYTKIISFIDDFTIEINCDLDMNEEERKKIFIYGKKVVDFHKLDYQSLYCLNIKATQELIIKNMNLEERLKRLEEIISNL